MKYLKIEDGKGYFLNNEGEYMEIDTIDKDSILILLSNALENDSFEMDDMKDNTIHNEADKIIYSKLYYKFDELNKDAFADECKSLYHEAFEKYCSE